MGLEKFKKVLTFFAHPDDEVLASGATLSKLARNNADIHITIPATGIHARSKTQNKASRDKDMIILRENCKEAIETLGINPKQIYFGEFQDNKMDVHPLLDLIQWLEEKIARFKPDLILTHHRYCTNIDHQYCHEAVVVGTRPAVNSHISILCGEISGCTGYLRPSQWEPNFYVEVSEQDMELKIKALETYKTEARSDPHPRSKEVLMALGKLRGSEAGFPFAEAFMIQKTFG